MKKINSDQKDSKNRCTVEKMQKFPISSGTGERIVFFRIESVSFPNRFKTKKKSSQKVISFKSYEMSKSLKKTKITKITKKMARHFKLDFDFS